MRKENEAERKRWEHSGRASRKGCPTILGTEAVPFLTRITIINTFIIFRSVVLGLGESLGGMAENSLTVKIR
jgi:hypothetical protein